MHGHPHDDAQTPPRRGHAPSRALSLSLALTLGYGMVEIAMGLWSGSLSLLADASHMLTDSGALVLALIVARIARRPRTSTQTYGYRRAEVVGAFVNASAMVVLSALILVEAAGRIGKPTPVHGVGLFYTAIIGLLVNGLSALLLMRDVHAGLHVRSALLHVLGDALGSLAAIVAGACVLWLGVAVADPIASVVIALVIGTGAVRLLREAVVVLMEGVPADLDLGALTRTIEATPGVAAVHDLHVWCLTPKEPMLTAHVVLCAGAHGTDVASRVGERLLAQHGVGHVTIQPEAPAAELVPLRVPLPKKKT